MQWWRGPRARAGCCLEFSRDVNLRKSLAKVLEKVRGAKAPGSPRAKGASSILRSLSGDVTGRTIYGDRPLRFRRLSVPDPELPSITDPTAFDTAFKIRIGHLLHNRQLCDTDSSNGDVLCRGTCWILDHMQPTP